MIRWMAGWMDGWMKGWIEVRVMEEWMWEWLEGWRVSWLAGWLAGWMDGRMNQWTNGQTDEAVNSLPTVHSNTSLNLGTTLAIRALWMSLGMQARYIPAIFSPSSIQLPAHCRGGNVFFWKVRLSASHLHAVAGPSTLCICTGWGIEFSEDGTKTRDSGLAFPTPQGGRRHPMPHPPPTTVICFLNKPWDGAVWGYKSTGNQMLTCK